MKQQHTWFCQQVEQHKTALYRLAYSILHNEEDAKDAVAEAVYKAFSRLDCLRQPEQFKAWLLRLSKNLVEFRRVSGEINYNSFSAVTCAWQKTLLRPQTCEQSAAWGPRQNPAERFWLGEEEQGSGAMPARKGGMSGADFATTSAAADCNSPGMTFIPDERLLKTLF